MRRQSFSLFGAAFLILTIALLSGLFAAGARVSARAQATDPRTVQDYFLLLPERYAGISRARREEMLRSGNVTVDLRNGYISYQDSAEDRSAIALFRRPDGSHLIAVTYLGPDLRVNPNFEEVSRISFLRYANGRWSDVTRSTLPIPFNSRLTYELPRYGTTIKVTGRRGQRAYDLVWANGRFTVSR